jgi:hypothetical protein
MHGCDKDNVAHVGVWGLVTATLESEGGSTIDFILGGSSLSTELLFPG